MSRKFSRALGCGLALGLATAGTAPAANPPGQPASGPGGSNYPHTGTPFMSGVAGVGGYAVYEPNPRPTGETPVVVVLHGTCIPLNPCNTSDPLWVKNNGPMMTHLAKKGNVVIFPRYHQDANTPAPGLQMQKAVDGIKAALNWLETTPGKTNPDVSRLGLTGNSLGGWMTVHTAAALIEDGAVPHPDWAVSFAAGQDDWSAGQAVPDEDLSLLPSDMRLLVAVGDNDSLAGEGTPRYGSDRVFYGTTTIPLSKKDYVRTRSDQSGLRKLDADHGYAVDTPKVDAMDYYATWKFLDAMRDCTGFGTFCSYVHGDTATQRYMGVWSNGVPVKEMCITNSPLTQLSPPVWETWTTSCQVSPT